MMEFPERMQRLASPSSPMDQAAQADIPSARTQIMSRWASLAMDSAWSAMLRAR